MITRHLSKFGLLIGGASDGMLNIACRRWNNRPPHHFLPTDCPEPYTHPVYADPRSGLAKMRFDGQKGEASACRSLFRIVTISPAIVNMLRQTWGRSRMIGLAAPSQVIDQVPVRIKYPLFRNGSVDSDKNFS